MSGHSDFDFRVSNKYNNQVIEFRFSYPTPESGNPYDLFGNSDFEAEIRNMIKITVHPAIDSWVFSHEA